MSKNFLLLTCLFLFCTAFAFPQGLETQASKDDWEEINFEFDSSVLVDGFPSLLRLAELLSANPDYRVQLEGHADYRGTDQYNVRLSTARAQTVKDFLVKYGARENQVSIVPRGENVPRVERRTPEAMFMNRRVAMTVRDGQGRIVTAGGVGDAINALEEIAKKQEECCNKILDKLDKLDEILALLKDLKGENDKLKQEVADLRQAQSGIKDEVSGLAAAPKPPTREDISEVVKSALPEPSKKFSVLNLNVGPDTEEGNLTATGKGRVFLPFAGRHAIQAEGEFMHFFDRDEGQVDLGLVNRFGNMQASIFTSFKHVKFDAFQHGGSLGQAAGTLDYVFNRGRIGVFGTKGFMDGAVLNRAILRPNEVEEAYLSMVDQLGFSATVAAWRNAWFEGNIGALYREGADNKAGGTIRYIHPITDRIAFTAEAGLNETLITDSNTGRVAFGLQFGGWLNPRDYASDMDRPVPVEIPRIRYEVRTRRVRTGNDVPIADAGPDQIGIEAGPVTLDGSNSFDPDDDPITFQWEQVGGPPIELSGADSAQASFTAAEGQTYHFRLAVRDDRNGIGTDRVTVSTLDRHIRILRFTAQPLTVNQGESVTLVWEVQNAEEAEISGVGEVDPAGGSTTVTLTETTTFTLTARNPRRETSQSVTVTVAPQQAPRILRFTASPDEVQAGDPTTLTWEVENADQVMISGLGSVDLSGSSSVNVDQTTTFTLTATNAAGEVSATAVVIVGMPVRIIDFTAEPTVAANPGDPVTLRWSTENATKVVITGVGEVEPNGSIQVNPVAVTTYNLLASDGRNQVQAVVVVKIENPNRSPLAVATAPWLILVPAGTQIGTTQLDGSGSSDPDGDPITFSWRSIGALEAEVTNPAAVTPNVRLLGGYGEYLFELTVTDDKGARSTDTVKLLFADP